MKTRMRVLLVDDHVIVRKGVKEILTSSSVADVIGEAGDIQSALDFVREHEIDVILLDINLPDQYGIDVIDNIKDLSPQTRILVLSMYPPEQYALRAIKAGASGYLKKDASPDELISAVKKVYSGGQYVTPEVGEMLASSLHSGMESIGPDSLSPREFQILRLIAQGVKLKDIADRLSVSPKTVSTYRSRIMEKLELESNADLIIYAKNQNIID
jgi:two-component system invasion response regulator UvrY